MRAAHRLTLAVGHDHRRAGEGDQVLSHSPLSLHLRWSSNRSLRHFGHRQINVPSESSFTFEWPTALFQWLRGVLFVAPISSS
jgi:hypothetical protein